MASTDLAPSGRKSICKVILANTIAKPFLNEIREVLMANTNSHTSPKLVAFLATDDEGSRIYAEYTAKTCSEINIAYEVRPVDPEDVEAEIIKANEDPAINGVVVYYPIFRRETRRDQYLQSVVCPEKDAEGLSHQYIFNMYQNVRFLDAPKNEIKSILPCTPLAIIKVLEYIQVYNSKLEYGNRLYGKTITVINRSEVVGRPLAALLANDGATVYSVDVNGIQIFSRGEGIRQPKHDCHHTTKTLKDVLPVSDVVISGVPSKAFKVPLQHLKAGVICINFANDKNFDPEVKDKASIYIPAIGKVTIAILLRNILRLVHIQRDHEVRSNLTSFYNPDQVFQLHFAYEDGRPTYPVEIYWPGSPRRDLTPSTTPQRGLVETPEDLTVQSTAYPEPPRSHQMSLSTNQLWGSPKPTFESHNVASRDVVDLENAELESSSDVETWEASESSDYDSLDDEDCSSGIVNNQQPGRKDCTLEVPNKQQPKDRDHAVKVYTKEQHGSSPHVPSHQDSGVLAFGRSPSSFESRTFKGVGYQQLRPKSHTPEVFGNQRSHKRKFSSEPFRNEPSKVQKCLDEVAIMRDKLYGNDASRASYKSPYNLRYTIGTGNVNAKTYNVKGLRFTVITDSSYVKPNDYQRPSFGSGGPGGSGYWYRGGYIVTSPSIVSTRKRSTPTTEEEQNYAAQMDQLRQFMPVLYATGEVIGTIAQVCTALGGDVLTDPKLNYHNQRQVFSRMLYAQRSYFNSGAPQAASQYPRPETFAQSLSSKPQAKLAAGSPLPLAAQVTSTQKMSAVQADLASRFGGQGASTQMNPAVLAHPTSHFSSQGARMQKKSTSAQGSSGLAKSPLPKSKSLFPAQGSSGSAKSPLPKSKSLFPAQGSSGPAKSKPPELKSPFPAQGGSTLSESAKSASSDSTPTTKVGQIAKSAASKPQSLASTNNDSTSSGAVLSFCRD